MNTYTIEGFGEVPESVKLLGYDCFIVLNYFDNLEDPYERYTRCLVYRCKVNNMVLRVQRSETKWFCRVKACVGPDVKVTNWHSYATLKEAEEDLIGRIQSLACDLTLLLGNI